MSDIAEIYKDGTYSALNPLFGDDTASWKTQNVLKAIDNFAIPHSSIAEIGCGGGAIIAAVCHELRSENAIGYEPMPEAYEVAKRRENENLRFVNGSVSSGTKERFDLVLCLDVFEHVEDYFSFLRNIKLLAEHFLFHIPMDMTVHMVALYWFSVTLSLDVRLAS